MARGRPAARGRGAGRRAVVGSSWTTRGPGVATTRRSAATETEPHVSTPNLVVVVSDDHAAQALSAYDETLTHTPHLDRMAAEGMRFDACFCTNSICSPSRASMLTGTYNHVNGVTTLPRTSTAASRPSSRRCRRPAGQPDCSASGTSATAVSTTHVGSTTGRSCTTRASTTTRSCCTGPARTRVTDPTACWGTDRMGC